MAMIDRQTRQAPPERARVLSRVRHAASSLVTETGLPRADDRLRPIRHLQLSEDAGHVVADRLQAEEELISDRLIVPAGGDQGENLPFPLGQLGEEGGGG